MDLRFRKQIKTNEKSSLFSLTKSQQPLSLKKINKSLNLKIDTKATLRVYIDEEENKKYVDAAAAYALGLTSVRAIMTGESRYKEITDDGINKLKERDYEVEYIILPKKQKQKIQLLYEDNRHYISSGAAYALGYIDVTKFNMDDNIYGPLTEVQLKNIKDNFKVEFKNIKTQNKNSKAL